MAYAIKSTIEVLRVTVCHYNKPWYVDTQDMQWIDTASLHIQSNNDMW